MPDDLLALEREAVADSTAQLRDRVNVVSGRVLSLWDAMPERMRASTMAEAIRLVGSDDTITTRLADWSIKAQKAGAAGAAKRLGVAVPTRAGPSSRATADALHGAQKAVRAEVRKAASLMESAKTLSDAQAALAVLGRSVYRAESAVRFTVNSSLTDGVTAVNAEHGALDLWVAERDACVHCLAHAGHTVQAGGDFPNLTFGVKPLAGANPRPPLHPNCRCRIVPHLPSWGSSYPDALKREAARSVLRGWSRPSESEKVRLKAAEDLLKRGSTLPRSVQDYARRSIRKGSFGRGTVFPDLPTDPRDEIEVRPGVRIRVPSIETPRGDVWAALPRKKDPVTEGFSRYIESTYGWTSGVDEIDGDIRAVNPNFADARQWQVNCQRVAVAYELRRRGFDVGAKGNDKRPGTKQYTRTDLQLVWRKEWIGPGGEQRAPGSVGAVEVQRNWTYVTVTDRLARLEEIVRSWPPGARGWVTNVWSGGGGHVWNVERKADGTIVWLDAQPGHVLDAAEIARYVRDSQTIHVMRVDDLEPADEQAGMVKPR